jgi:hypothetical protein
MNFLIFKENLIFFFISVCALYHEQCSQTFSFEPEKQWRFIRFNEGLTKPTRLHQNMTYRPAKRPCLFPLLLAYYYLSLITKPHSESGVLQCVVKSSVWPQGADHPPHPPFPFPLSDTTAGRNHFEQVNYPHPPHWDRRAI